MSGVLEREVDAIPRTSTSRVLWSRTPWEIDRNSEACDPCPLTIFVVPEFELSSYENGTVGVKVLEFPLALGTLPYCSPMVLFRVSKGDVPESSSSDSPLVLLLLLVVASRHVDSSLLLDRDMLLRFRMEPVLLSLVDAGMEDRFPPTVLLPIAGDVNALSDLSVMMSGSVNIFYSMNDSEDRVEYGYTGRALP